MIPFGVNGAIFASIAFYLLRFKDRLHLQTLSQQMIMIFMMVFVSEIFRSYVPQHGIAPGVGSAAADPCCEQYAVMAAVSLDRTTLSWRALRN